MNGAEYKEKTSQKAIQLSQYNSKIKTTKKIMRTIKYDKRLFNHLHDKHS